MTTATKWLAASFILGMSAAIVGSVMWNSEGIVWALGTFSFICGWIAFFVVLDDYV